MNIIYLIFGIILFLITATDIVYTVLSSNGAGYLSKYSMKYTAATFAYAARRTNSRKILKFAGVSLLSSITFIWILLLWIGVFFVFLSDYYSVFDSKTSVPASTIDRFYFSGYLLSTLGNGDFAPATGVWQIVTTLFTFSGFIFLTTGITYFVSILSAVTEKRQTALSVFNLGETSDEIASAIKDLNDKGQLMSEVSGLKNLFNRLTLNHTSYPISHYFFAIEKERSISVAAAELNQALDDLSGDKNLFVQLKPLKDSFNRYLQVLAERFLADLLKGKVIVTKGNIKDAATRKQIIEALLYKDVWLEKLSNESE